MMYETAVLKLQEMNHHYAAIDFTTNIRRQPSENGSKVRLYVQAEPGATGYFTEYHLDFAGAFAELEKHLNDELPGTCDEAPSGDTL